MWKKSKSLYLTTFLILSLSVFAPSFSSGVAGYSIPQTEPQTTIVVQLDQWNMLKQELIAQENDLNQLKLKLKMLKSTSSEQMQLLNDLQNELKKTKEDLQNANSSLTKCQSALQESKKSLQILKEQIQALEHKQVVTRRQRDAYALLAAISLGSVVAR